MRNLLVQNITDLFQFGKQINQIKRLFTPDINHGNIYEEIPHEVSALNDPLETSKWLELYEGNIKNDAKIAARQDGGLIKKITFTKSNLL